MYMLSAGFLLSSFHVYDEVVVERRLFFVPMALFRVESGYEAASQTVILNGNYLFHAVLRPRTITVAEIRESTL